MAWSVRRWGARSPIACAQGFYGVIGFGAASRLGGLAIPYERKRWQAPFSSGSARRSHPAAAQASASLSRGVCTESPAAAGRSASTKPPGGRTRRDSASTPEKRHVRGESRRSGNCCLGAGRREHAAHEPLISRATLADVPLTWLSFSPPRLPQPDTDTRARTYSSRTNIGWTETWSAIGSMVRGSFWYS